MTFTIILHADGWKGSRVASKERDSIPPVTKAHVPLPMHVAPGLSPFTKMATKIRTTHMGIELVGAGNVL